MIAIVVDLGGKKEKTKNCRQLCYVANGQTIQFPFLHSVLYLGKIVLTVIFFDTRIIYKIRRENMKGGARTKKTAR